MVIFGHRSSYMASLTVHSPISTYGGRGTSKRGLDPSTHAIIHTVGSCPTYVSGETELQKNAIAVEPPDEAVRLSPASRINFGIHHPIQHNVKVKNLGMVKPECMPSLIYFARSESGW